MNNNLPPPSYEELIKTVNNFNDDPNINDNSKNEINKLYIEFKSCMNNIEQNISEQDKLKKELKKIDEQIIKYINNLRK